jgi:hypothetical protein
MHDASVGLRIRGDTAEDSKRIFGALRARKETIEQKFGCPLEWEPKEDVTACFAVHPMDTGGWKDEDSWPEIQEEMVDAMVALEQAMALEIEGYHNHKSHLAEIAHRAERPTSVGGRGIYRPEVGRTSSGVSSRRLYVRRL